MTSNSGQICFAATRVYVQSGIYDKFITAYTEGLEAKRKVLGDPENERNEIGPVVDKAQYERILGIISMAKQEKQGTLLSGGSSLGSGVSTY